MRGLLFSDDAATEADVARVEDGGLAGGGAFDWLSKVERGRFWVDLAVDERGAVAEADLETMRVGGRRVEA